MGAGSAPARNKSARSLADWTVKLPEMMPLPPRIGSRMTGALITLLSRTIAKGFPTFSRVASPNFLAPTESNLKLTTGSLFWNVATDHNALADDIRSGAAAAACTALLHSRQDLVTRRQPAPPSIFYGDTLVHELKCQLRGAPEQLLDALRVVDAGQLDEDAVLPFALDRRLFCAGLVDAAADDLDRLLED